MFRDHDISVPLVVLSFLCAVMLIACGGDDSTTTDASMDAPTDTGGGDGSVDCATAPDGTSCGTGAVCILGDCLPSRCGDGVVDMETDEECDDGNDVASDGCEPGSCTFTCTEDADCDDGDPCSGAETCNVGLNRCQAGGSGDGEMCTNAMGMAGVCSAGLCADPGCGNSVVDGVEDCDDGQNGDNDDGCRDDCSFTCAEDLDCSDGDPCNGEEVCDTGPHTCGMGADPDCDDADPCTADACDSGSGCTNDAIDVDMDGFSPGACTTAGISGGDCDDTNGTVFPGAPELCDMIDNDCDSMVDDGTVDVDCYTDADGDGYGSDSATPVSACTCPVGTVPNNDDCLDRGSSSSPPLVNPDHTSYETSGYCRSGGSICLVSTISYDWNCDGTEERLLTTTASSCGLLCSPSGICSCRGSGWVGATPACGVSGTYRTCGRGGLVICGQLSQRSRRQECR